jgi:hypothetical protein
MPDFFVCPGVQTWEKLRQGRLPLEAVEELARHLETCTTCAALVQAPDLQDSLEIALRASALPPLAEPGPVVQQVMQNVHDLLPALPSGGAETTVRPSDLPSSSEALPARLGRYRIEGEIARGGMGRVLRVLDEDFQRPLAMKVLLDTGRGQPLLEERFMREARITGQLQHPGVPPVQELGRLPVPSRKILPSPAPTWAEGQQGPEPTARPSR